MKKTLFSLMFLAVSCIMMATPSKIVMKLASPAGASDRLSLFEDADFSADFDQDYDATKNMNDGMTFSVNLYVEAAWGNAQGYAVADLEGTKVKFQSNSINADVYTITFSTVTAENYFLKDNMVQGADENDSLTAIVAGETYSFTQAVSTTEERFEIVTAPVPAVYTRNVTAGQWGTICYPASITEVQGGVLYELTDATETEVYGLEVDLSGDNTTVAGQPYVFQADADATQLVMPYTAGTEAMNPVPAKGLVGTFFGLEGVPAGAYGIMNNYVVEIAAGNPLLANRAYIKMEDLKVAPGAPVRGRAIFKIANTPTNLDEVAAGMADGTYMINGQVVLVKGGKMFNVLGL